MEKMTAIIIEDDLTWQRKFGQILKDEYSEIIEVLGFANSIEGGVNLIQSQNPEILFLDIKLVGGTAFDILARVKWTFKRIIFVTDYPVYLKKATEEAKAFFLGFIEKDLAGFKGKLATLLESYDENRQVEVPSKDIISPLSRLMGAKSIDFQKDLQDLLGILTNQKNEFKKGIVLKDAFNRIFRFSFDAIIALEKKKIDGRIKAILYTTNHQEPLSFPIQEFQKAEKLPSTQFFQYRERIKKDVPAGYINRDYIDFCEKQYIGKNYEYDVKLRGKLLRTVSTTKSKEFEKWLKS